MLVAINFGKPMVYLCASCGVCCSNFAEVFDVDWFIKYLSKDVQIVKKLPIKVGKPLTPHSMRVPRKCDPKCYETHVLPVLKKKHVSIQNICTFGRFIGF